MESDTSLDFSTLGLSSLPLPGGGTDTRRGERIGQDTCNCPHDTFSNSRVGNSQQGRRERTDRSQRSTERNDRSHAGDPLSRLPARAAEKLLSLRQEVEDIATFTARDVDQYQELIQDRAKAQQRIAQLTDVAAALRGGDGHIYSADHPSVISARAELDRLSAQLESLQARQKANTPRRNATSNLLRSVEAYAKSLGPNVAPFESDAVELPAGETPTTAVERLRLRRRELLVGIKAVDASPVHSSIVKAKLHKQIEELAERGIPDVYRIIEGGNPVRFARSELTFSVSGFVPSVEGVPAIVARASGPIPDALGLIAHLFKDQLIAALEAEVDAASDDTNALSPQERVERTAAINAELLTTERLEESFTELAAGAVIRRADLDPRAFFGITGPDPRGD